MPFTNTQPMKPRHLLLLFLACTLLNLAPRQGFGQSFATLNTARPVSKFALSFNPLGFVQFGPVVSAEFGIRENLVINTHVRVPVLGVLTYAVKYHDDGLDNLGGIAIGGGVLKFFGEDRNKPYAGGLAEYDYSSMLYGEFEQWEWSRVEHSGVLIFNGGYRFRFETGFFINAGAYLGAAFGAYNWEYSDLTYGVYDNEPRQGLSATPFGMLELTFGKEFLAK